MAGDQHATAKAPAGVVDRNRLQVYFSDATTGAEQVRHALHRLDTQVTDVQFGNLAVVRRAASGAVSVNESADLPNRAGVVSVLPFVGMAAIFVAQERDLIKTSATTAALISGSLGLVLAVAINVGDLGVADTALVEVGRQLSAGTSALLMLSRPDEEHLLSTILTKAGGTRMDVALAPAVAAKFRSTLIA